MVAVVGIAVLTFFAWGFFGPQAGWIYGFVNAVAVLLLAVHFSTLTLIAGWGFKVDQFRQFWYFVLHLAAGFGIQIGLFTRLRELARTARKSGAVATTSGTPSAAAMVTCCAHYLTNVAPVIGATGPVAFASQFQTALLWVGLLINLSGVLYIGNKVLQASRAQGKFPA